MIRTEIRFKNLAFIKALEESEYNSIAEFSRVSGIGYHRLIYYANLRYSFKNPEEQIKIARLLNTEVFELFEQYEEIVHKNKGMASKLTTDIPVDKILSLSSSKILRIESDYNTDDIINKESLKIDINDMLDTIPEREEKILRLLFGLNEDKEEYTLKEVGEKCGITRERVRQIKVKAIRRLRHRARSRKLRTYGFTKLHFMKEQ